MGDPCLQKTAISGPTLASMIQRFSTSPGAVDGLIFGYVTEIKPSALSDDSSDTDSSALVVTITGFLCTGTINSFYDSSGRVDSLSLSRLLRHQPQAPAQTPNYLLGWFSGRRNTQLRPSMREFAVTASLSSKSQFSFPVKNGDNPTNLTPRLFLLFASPLSDQIIHTHEYRAYQFRASTEPLEPKTMDVVNIGPAFRGNYESFSPNSPFPILPFELRASPMNEDRNEERLNEMKQILKDQKELDKCAEGLEVGSLSRLMGSEAANYTAGVEDLYQKMLVKIECLSRNVEKSSAKVLEQELLNRRIRYKLAKIPGVE